MKSTTKNIKNSIINIRIRKSRDRTTQKEIGKIESKEDDAVDIDDTEFVMKPVMKTINVKVTIASIEKYKPKFYFD